MNARYTKYSNLTIEFLYIEDAGRCTFLNKFSYEFRVVLSEEEYRKYAI